MATPRYTREQSSKLAYDTLLDLARKAGLSGERLSRFLLATMAISYHESGGYDNYADGRIDPSEQLHGSHGLWQLNLSPAAHGNVISLDDARDPVSSTRYWFPSLLRAFLNAENRRGQWDGSNLDWLADYAPSAQVSYPWSLSMATNALAGARSAIARITGSDPSYQPTPNPFDPSDPVLVTPSFNPTDIPGVRESIEGFTKGLKPLGDFFAALRNPDTYQRVGVGALGVLLVTGGIAALLLAERNNDG